MEEYEIIETTDGKYVKAYFPKVAVERGGIRYTWEKLKEDENDETLIDIRKELAQKISDGLWNTPRKGWPAGIEEALKSYAVIVLEEMQERLDKEV